MGLLRLAARRRRRRPEHRLRWGWQADATFAIVCDSSFQLRRGKIIAVETDRRTTVQIAGKRIELEAMCR